MGVSMALNQQNDMSTFHGIHHMGHAASAHWMCICSQGRQDRKADMLPHWSAIPILSLTGQQLPAAHQHMLAA
jgi:hypothetical protein